MRELLSQVWGCLLVFLALQKHFVSLARLPAWLSRALIADGFVPNAFLWLQDCALYPGLVSTGARNLVG